MYIEVTTDQQMAIVVGESQRIIIKALWSNQLLPDHLFISAIAAAPIFISLPRFKCQLIILNKLALKVLKQNHEVENRLLRLFVSQIGTIYWISSWSHITNSFMFEILPLNVKGVFVMIRT